MRLQLQCRSSLSDAETAALVGKTPRAEDATFVTRSGDASVFKPGGQRLMTILRGAIPKEELEQAFPFMWSLRKNVSTNRGAYAGEDRDNPRRDKGGVTIGKGKRYRPVKGDGTVSNTNQAAPVRSVVVGAFDRSPRIPYCRQTHYTMEAPGKWARALPYIQRIARLFQETVPERYAVQQAEADRVHGAYVIPETPFSTLTVNNTVAGAYHTDKGDYKPGFGVITCLRRGQYRGAELIFPKYGVGADLQHGDVMFFDPHEVHGNVPFSDGVGREAEEYIRITIVLYLRTRMTECLEPALELEKNVRGGLEP